MALVRIIHNPTRKRGISECFLAYASGYYCDVFWEKQPQPLFTKQLPAIAAEIMNNPRLVAHRPTLGVGSWRVWPTLVVGSF